MTAAITFDTGELNAAIADKMARTKRDMAQIVNQAAFNVAARAMRETKQADGRKVHDYLRLMGGRPKGGRVGGSNRFGSRHKRGARMLRSVTLIAQSIYFKTHGHGIGLGKSNKRTKRIRQITAQQASLFGKNGKRKVNDYGYSLAAKANKVVVGSDYGEAMQKYAGKIFNRAVRSVGYLKAVWVPVLIALGGLVKFRAFAKGLNYKLRWRTSSAIGAATPAKDGESVAAFLDVGAHAKRMTAGAQAEVSRALQKAIRDEEAEMRRHEQEMLTK